MAHDLTESKDAASIRNSATSSTKDRDLDIVDVAILTALQRDARISNNDLADQVGLSAPSACRRTAALEERGLIKGYHAKLDPRSLGFEVTAFIAVALRSQAQSDVAEFETAMQDNPNIRECHALSGHTDFLIKGIFPELADCNDFVRDVLVRTFRVRRVQTSLSTTRARQKLPVPMEMVEVRLPIGEVRTPDERAFDIAAE